MRSPPNSWPADNEKPLRRPLVEISSAAAGAGAGVVMLGAGSGAGAVAAGSVLVQAQAQAGRTQCGQQANQWHYTHRVLLEEMRGRDARCAPSTRTLQQARCRDALATAPPPKWLLR